MNDLLQVASATSEGKDYKAASELGMCTVPLVACNDTCGALVCGKSEITNLLLGSGEVAAQFDFESLRKIANDGGFGNVLTLAFPRKEDFTIIDSLLKILSKMITDPKPFLRNCTSIRVSLFLVEPIRPLARQALNGRFQSTFLGPCRATS